MLLNPNNSGANRRLRGLSPQRPSINTPGAMNMNPGPGLGNRFGMMNPSGGFRSPSFWNNTFSNAGASRPDFRGLTPPSTGWYPSMGASNFSLQFPNSGTINPMQNEQLRRTGAASILGGF